jgi:hypothetical protein
MNEHVVLPILVPIAFLALIFLAVSCIGCTDRVVEFLRRAWHARRHTRVSPSFEAPPRAR